MSVLVLAPHPDDETLGCGGTLLRHRAEGTEVHWLIVTEMKADAGFSSEEIAQREEEISAVSAHFGFAGTHRLGHATATLDSVPLVLLAGQIGRVVAEVRPTTVYLPHRGDAHSDHAAAVAAAAGATKVFRYPSVRQVRAYEVPSETDFGLDPSAVFRPNLFVDISAHLEGKLDAVRLYASEIGEHPFPRSIEGVRSLARVRGAVAGVAAAESFMTLREIL